MLFCLLCTLALAFWGVPACAAGSVRPAPEVAQAHRSRVVPVLRSDPRSGQLVHIIVVAPKPRAGKAPVKVGAPAAREIRSLVEAAARRHQVSPELVASVIQVESNYDPYAVSPKGALGLMQLMPSTAQRFGVRDAFDPLENIDGGVRYLKFLKETFGSDQLALAAYNAGEGAVYKYGRVPPYPETMDYVAKVGKKYGQAKRAAEAPRTSAAVQNEPAKEPEFRHLAEYIDAAGQVYLRTQ